MNDQFQQIYDFPLNIFETLTDKELSALLSHFRMYSNFCESEILRRENEILSRKIRQLSV